MIYTQYLILWPTNADQYDKSGTVYFKSKIIHSTTVLRSVHFRKKQITQMLS